MTVVAPFSPDGRVSSRGASSLGPGRRRRRLVPGRGPCATDASDYHGVPAVVVTPRIRQDIIEVLRNAGAPVLALTFRGGEPHARVVQ
jgi:hypothetical protein